MYPAPPVTKIFMGLLTCEGHEVGRLPFFERVIKGFAVNVKACPFLLDSRGGNEGYAKSLFCFPEEFRAF